MTAWKDILRQCTPYGLIQRRRRQARLRRLGLFPGKLNPVDCEEAVSTCRFDLWPESIRNNSDWTLVDVGANEGDFIRAVHKLASPAAVIAFEPLPTLAPILASLLEKIPNGWLKGVAVGAAPGELRLKCTANARLSSFLEPRHGIEQSYEPGDYKVSDSINVPVVRLDDEIPSNTRIGLLKIDVQGYELEALRGARQTLSHTEALLLEINYVSHYEGAASFEEVQQFLHAAGFRLYGVSAPYVDNERPLWADAMYVPANTGIKQPC